MNRLLPLCFAISVSGVTTTSPLHLQGCVDPRVTATCHDCQLWGPCEGQTAIRARVPHGPPLDLVCRTITQQRTHLPRLHCSLTSPHMSIANNWDDNSVWIIFLHYGVVSKISSKTKIQTLFGCQCFAGALAKSNSDNKPWPMTAFHLCRR